MKNIKKIVFFVIATTALIGTIANAAIPSGTVVLGGKAFDLNYANAKANEDEIGEALTSSGGNVYVKMFDGSWIDNISGQTIDQSKVPAVTYKDPSGVASSYKTADGDLDSTQNSDDFTVVSIE